jgi:hypothetical protein
MKQTKKTETMKTEFHTYLEGKARTDVAYEATPEAISILAENYEMKTKKVTQGDREAIANFLIEKATGNPVDMNLYQNGRKLDSSGYELKSTYEAWMKF